MPTAPTDVFHELEQRARLAEALADWRWAEQVEAGWEHELHEVMRQLEEARQEVDLRRAEYLELVAEVNRTARGTSMFFRAQLL